MISYKRTKLSCYAGYFVQAIINNLPPLLFIVFHEQFGIDLKRLSALITVNFVSQIAVDLFAIKFSDKIGYKILSVLSQSVTAVGLILLAFLPNVINPFTGIMIAIILNAIGSGLMEVIISPIIEAIPSDKKTSQMAFLHSFYCWGQVFVVLVTTLLIKFLGKENWHFIPLLWAILPAVNTVSFISCPMPQNLAAEERTPVGKLFFKKQFILMLLLMLCAGASELGMSQWSSYFAETGLHVTKQTGDILGPFMFAVLMGIGRILFGIFGEKLNIKTALGVSAALCAMSYIIVSMSNNSYISLIFCAFTGICISMMWPGTFSLAARKFPEGGNSMFGILALSGDMGCTLGPWVVSFAALHFCDGNLKGGLGFGALFPIIMIISLVLIKGNKSKKQTV